MGVSVCNKFGAKRHLWALCRFFTKVRSWKQKQGKQDIKTFSPRPLAKATFKIHSSETQNISNARNMILVNLKNVKLDFS